MHGYYSYYELENIRYNLEELTKNQKKVNQFLVKKNNELDSRVEELELLCKYLLSQFKESNYDSYQDFKKKAVPEKTTNNEWFEPLLYSNIVECYQFDLDKDAEATQTISGHPIKKIKIFNDDATISGIKKVINKSIITYFNFFENTDKESLDTLTHEYLLKYNYNDQVCNVFITSDAINFTIFYNDKKIEQKEFINQNDVLNLIEDIFAD